MAHEGLDRLTEQMNTAILVVTTQADGHRSGCVVGFSTQASINPPRLLVCLSQTNHTFGVAARSDHLAVHLLAHQDRALAELFGGETDDEIDKFDHCAWHSGPQQMPILDDAIGWLVGETLERIDLGDHVGYLLAPGASWFADTGDDPLRLSDVMDIDPGHDP